MFNYLFLNSKNETVKEYKSKLFFSAIDEAKIINEMHRAQYKKGALSYEELKNKIITTVKGKKLSYSL